MPLYLVLFLIVVAVGGLGRMRARCVAALVIGVFDSCWKYLFAEGGGLFVYALTIAVLLVRPRVFRPRARP